MARRLRLRRGTSRRPLDEMVAASRAEHEVQAYVEARLLGVRLLSLRARVVTGTPAPPATVIPQSVDAPRVTVGGRRRLDVDGGSNSLGRAVDLLGESTTTLRELSLHGTGSG